MTDNNVLSINGRLVREAILSYSNGGTAILNFSIAVNRSVKKGDKWEDEASFFDCTLFSKFSKTAENLSKYLDKGKQVSIIGELVQNRWEKDGQKHSKVEIIVNKLQLLGSKDEQKQEKPSYQENFQDDGAQIGFRDRKSVVRERV